MILINQCYNGKKRRELEYCWVFLQNYVVYIKTLNCPSFINNGIIMVFLYHWIRFSFSINNGIIIPHTWLVQLICAVQSHCIIFNMMKEAITFVHGRNRNICDRCYEKLKKGVDKCCDPGISLPLDQVFFQYQ
jgi:hypothetical protein